jgi:hypothetical protein
MLGNKEGFLPVQDRRVVVRREVPHLDPERLEMHRHGPGEGRVGIALELRVAQVRDLGLLPEKLDDVGALDPADIAAGTALEDS